MDNVQKFDARVKDICDTANLIEPKIVPVMANILTWSIGYAKGDVNYLLDNLDELPDLSTKFMDEVYIDANLMYGLTTPIRALEKMGSDAYFVSADDHTIQHKENSVMQRDDYGDFIDDPLNFMVDILGKRKFPALSKNEDEVYKTLIDVATYLDSFAGSIGKCMALAKEKYGVVPMIGGAKVYPALDVLFDRLRGFSGLLTDLRRQRDNIKRAIDVLQPIYLSLAKNINAPFPYAATTLHCPTYLSKKDFEELFMPQLKEMVMEVYNRGSKTILFLEGTWKPFFEIMRNELPKASVLCILEQDDIVEAKKMIGDHFTLIGGVNTNLLKYASKQECLDDAKRIIDICAPGGGFIFSLGMVLISWGDVKLENLIAVNQFAHDYGKY